MEEEDLDEMLLSVTQKKQERAVESDDSSRVYEGDAASSDNEDGDDLDIEDSDRDDDDQDSDFDEDGKAAKGRGKKAAKRAKKESGGAAKSKGKKRSADEDQDWNDEVDEDGGDTEPSEFDDEYDEEMYKDVADRERLAKLTEAEREMVLTERYETRQKRRDEWDMRRKLKGPGKKLAKKDRPKKKDEKAKGSSKQAQKAAMDRLAAEQQKKKGVSRDIDDDWGDEMSDGDRDQPAKADVEGLPLGFEDIMDMESRRTTPLFVRRNVLMRWVKEAAFDRLVRGLFVKLSVGENFGGLYTNKRLMLSFGHNNRSFDMSLISNQSPTEQEFQRWVRQMDKDGEALPSRQEIEKKMEQVRQFLQNRIKPTEEEVQRHQENFEKVNPERINRVAKRKELSMKIKTAKLSNDDEAVLELENRLKLLEEVDKKLRENNEHQQGMGALASTSALLRQKALKNKAENDKKDKIAAIRRSQGSAETGGVFARLETSGQSYYSIKKRKSPIVPLASPKIGAKGGIQLDMPNPGDSGSKQRPPISKRFEFDDVGTEIFDVNWEEDGMVEIKYVPPALDLPRPAEKGRSVIPENLIMFDEFQKQRDI